MNITYTPPDREEAVTAIHEAVIAAIYQWPAGREYAYLVKQLEGHLHSHVSGSEFDELVEAYKAFLDVENATHWQMAEEFEAPRYTPEMDDAYRAKRLRTLTESFNQVLLETRSTIITDRDMETLVLEPTLKAVAA
ncbi:hypothetical protein D6T65_05120 [Arthrobacter frigidicola]|nr:hypothetical protein D6T65_05120 [Arthrobacter frigidicola]